MAHSEEDRKALGKRLSAARTLKALTIEAAARQLTALGYPITKQALGHWETGRNVPDALWLRRLAKLYGTTLDALVWDDSLTLEAIQLGAQFDALTEKQKSTLKAVWMAYIAESTTDADVERKMPITQKSKERERENTDGNITAHSSAGRSRPGVDNQGTGGQDDGRKASHSPPAFKKQ